MKDLDINSILTLGFAVFYTCYLAAPMPTLDALFLLLSLLKVFNEVIWWERHPICKVSSVN